MGVAICVVMWRPLTLASSFPVWVHLWVTYLAHLHSVINFWVYMATSKDYRVGYARALHLGTCVKAAREPTSSANKYATSNGKGTASTDDVCASSQNGKKQVCALTSADSAESVTPPVAKTSDVLPTVDEKY